MLMTAPSGGDSFTGLSGFSYSAADNTTSVEIGPADIAKALARNWSAQAYPSPPTVAQLQAANLVSPGITRYTADQGEVYSNGTAWVQFVTGSSGPSFQNKVSATLAASQNNYAPTGYVAGTTNALRLAAASGGSAITGIAAPASDFSVLLMNTSATDSITFPHQSSSSVAANRFICPNGVTNTLPPGGETILAYDSTTGAWRFAS